MIGREDIAEVTQNAVDKEEFADILFNHFDEMAESCCVSLGIDMAGRKVY